MCLIKICLLSNQTEQIGHDISFCQTLVSKKNIFNKIKAILIDCYFRDLICIGLFLRYNWKSHESIIVIEKQLPVPI